MFVLRTFQLYCSERLLGVVESVVIVRLLSIVHVLVLLDSFWIFWIVSWLCVVVLFFSGAVLSLRSIFASGSREKKMKGFR